MSEKTVVEVNSNDLNKVETNVSWLHLAALLAAQHSVVIHTPFVDPKLKAHPSQGVTFSKATVGPEIPNSLSSTSQHYLTNLSGCGPNLTRQLQSAQHKLFVLLQATLRGYRRKGWLVRSSEAGGPSLACSFRRARVGELGTRTRALACMLQAYRPMDAPLLYRSGLLSQLRYLAVEKSEGKVEGMCAVKVSQSVSVCSLPTSLWLCDRTSELTVDSDGTTLILSKETSPPLGTGVTRSARYVYPMCGSSYRFYIDGPALSQRSTIRAAVCAYFEATFVKGDVAELKENSQMKKVEVFLPFLFFSCHS
jgi:hypothetical protein